METRKTGRLGLAAAALVALGTLTGCGELTIRTWVKVIEADSTGFVQIGEGQFPFERIQGGFLAKVVVDTSTLPAPLDGTIEVEEIRLAAEEPSVLDFVCAWQNPNLPSTGTVHMDILGGTGSTQLTTNLRTTTRFGNVTEVSTPTSLNLEGDLLNKFLGAAESGAADGLFATRAAFEGTSVLLGIPVVFSMDLGVTNDSTPPVIDEDLLYECAWYWEPDQGSALFHGVNAKSSYLRAWPGDAPKAPRVISLADLGVAPGDTLHLDTIGTFADSTTLEDGTKTAMTAVFSSTSQILGTNQRNRIPGAIDAGTDINTGGYWSCFLIFCSFQSSDISQDFRVDPRTSVVVPAGANYLFVAPLAPSRKWADNSGFGFGVDADAS
jgi:hypothetical protein